jgi:hypothetical protein
MTFGYRSQPLFAVLVAAALVVCVSSAAESTSSTHLIFVSFDASMPPGSADAFAVVQSNPVDSFHQLHQPCPNMPLASPPTKEKHSGNSILDIFITTSNETQIFASLSEAALRVCHQMYHSSHHHDHLKTDGSVGGGRSENSLLLLPIILPSHVLRKSVTLSIRGKAVDERRHQHELSYSTDTQLLMQQRGINVTTRQQTNPRRARSITFVSAGYTGSEQGLFDSHVAAAISVLQGGSSAVNANPWPRYASILNFYSVYEPSEESGASRPHAPGHDCSTMTVCGPRIVQNNLRCSYGSPNPTLLSCDRAAVLSLASFAPASDIVVVLINDVDYGGTGGASVATVAAAPAVMGFLVVHELNHAVAGLGDEYSYGFSDRAVLPNCAATDDSRQVPWTYWIQTKAVDANPTRGCTYDNLYRPTSSGCLMHSSTSTSMCQVCKETLTLSLYSGGAGLALDEPRCPPSGFDVVVPVNESVTLSVNHRFSIFNDNVNISWQLPDGTMILGIPSVSVSGSQLIPGANIITVMISDRTTSLKSFGQVSGANYSTTFTLRRVSPSNANCQPLECRSSTGNVYSYCGTCTTDKCISDTIISPVTYTSSSKADIEQAKKNIFIVSIVVACTGFGLLIIVIIVWFCLTQRRTQPILHLSPGDHALMRLSTVCAILVLALVSIALVFAVKYFPQTVMFGQQIFISLIVIGSFVFLTAVANVMAVVAHWTILMYFCATLVFVVSLGMFAVGIVALYVRENFKTDTLQNSFAERWREEAAASPSVICAIQSALDCSGYQRGCFPLPNSYCPSNCDIPNQNPNGCKTVFEDWVNEKLFPIAVVTLICAFFFVISAFVVCIASSRVRRARASGQSRRTYRKDPRPPVPAITEPELAIFKQEFSKTDRNKTGFLRGEQLSTFVKDVFDEEELAPAEKIALETAGPMSADQVLKLYFPHMDGTAADPRQLTPEEAEGATDPVHLQQLQYAKMELFMVASGSLSPEALYILYRDFRKVSFTTTGKEFIDVMRQAAKENERTEDAEMCRGLSPQDLEGLRCAWVAIHPQVVGALTDSEIDKFYHWTHGAPLHTHEQFVRWKELLDVRSTGVIGWTEFCFPFAQRSLVKKARDYLASINRTVEVETLTRAEVAEEFGPVIVDMCFLPYEKSVPIERALEVAMRFQY